MVGSREALIIFGFRGDRLRCLPRPFLAALRSLDCFRRALVGRYEDAYRKFTLKLDGQVESSAFVGAHTEFGKFIDAVPPFPPAQDLITLRDALDLNPKTGLPA